MQDEVKALTANTALNWRMITAATIAVAADGRTATLTKDGKTLNATLLSPASAKFSIQSAAPANPAENQNIGYSILQATVPTDPAVTDQRVAVLLTPVGPKWPADLPPPHLEPLPLPTSTPTP